MTSLRSSFQRAASSAAGSCAAAAAAGTGAAAATVAAGGCAAARAAAGAPRLRGTHKSMPIAPRYCARVCRFMRATHEPAGGGGPRVRRRMRRPTHSVGADSAYTPNIDSSIVGGSMAISTKNSGTSTM